MKTNLFDKKEKIYIGRGMSILVAGTIMQFILSYINYYSGDYISMISNFGFMIFGNLMFIAGCILLHTLVTLKLNQTGGYKNGKVK